jgi:hypothetical protein
MNAAPAFGKAGAVFKLASTIRSGVDALTAVKSPKAIQNGL